MVSYWPYLGGDVRAARRRRRDRLRRRPARDAAGAGRSVRWPSCSSSARAATTSCGPSSRGRSGRPRPGWPPSSSRRAGRRSPRVLLTIALATSGVGLAFFVGTGVHLLLTRPRALAWLRVPVGLYLVWFVAVRRRRRSSARPRRARRVRPDRPDGERGRRARLDVAGRRVGRPPRARVRARLGCGRSRRSCSRCWSRASRSSSIAGLVRAQLGAEQATAPRYVYVAAPALHRSPGPSCSPGSRGRSGASSAPAVLAVALDRQRRAAGREPRPAPLEDRVRAGR